MASLFIFTYTTTWLFYVSKHPENKEISKFFPDVKFLIYGPIILLLIFCGGVGKFLKGHFDRMNKKKTN